MFESGLFGANGHAGLVYNNPDLLDDDVLRWNQINESWYRQPDIEFKTHRVVVTGDVIPEASTFVLFGLGLVGIAMARRNRTRAELPGAISPS